MLTYDQVLSSLQQARYAPMYLLCGTEPFYIDLLCNRFENDIVAKSASSTDRNIIYAGDGTNGDIANIVNLARTFPMLGNLRVVVLKDAQKIKKWEALQTYIKNPAPSSILVLCFRNATPDKRLSLWKDFEKNGGVWMQSDQIKGDNKLEEWTRNYLVHRIDEFNSSHPEREKLSLEHTVPQLLSSYIGNDLQSIANACEKLILGLPQNQNQINADVVERNIGISKNFNVFELQDALFQKNITKANVIVDYFSSSKEHVMVKELGVLFTAFANLMIYHYLTDKSEKNVAATLGIHPYFVSKYKQAASLYSASKTFKIIGYFRDIDAKNKGINCHSATDADLWKELIYKILY